MDKVDRLIEIARLLKEEGMSAAALGPTNKVGTGEKSLGYNIETETPPVFPKKKGHIYLGLGSRSRWMKPKS
jgi:hypothetical protein